MCGAARNTRRGYLLAYVTNKILLELRLKMFDRMIHTSAGFFQRETASTIINAIVFEVNQILNVLQSVVVTLVRDSLTVVFLAGLPVHPQLAADARDRGDPAGYRLAGEQDQSPVAAA